MAFEFASASPYPVSPEWLKRSVVFNHLDRDVTAAVAGQMVPMSVPGGRLLYARGESSGSLYILKSGSMGLFREPATGGTPELAGVVRSGETIGALEMLTGQRRRYDLRALRDSELLRLPREGFKLLAEQHPEAILGAARSALMRLEEEHTRPLQQAPCTFSLLPFDEGVEVRDLAERLQKILSAYGDCLLIDQAKGENKDSSWFAEVENRVTFILYVDEGKNRVWRELCRRQADVLLLVTDASRTEAPWPDRQALDQHASLERPRYLLLRHASNDILPGAARRWIRTFPRPVRQYHVREGRVEHDLKKLARLLTRNATGLVFSGGGARGFAAIGVVRALREAGVQIDSISGTSIGAIIGAGVALEWSSEHLYETCRHSFVDGRPLKDRTLPIVALSRGRRTSRLLQEAFGDVDIEDMPLDYCAVVTNLTSGLSQVRNHGRLWFWLRASCAIPGILPPVLHHRNVYVDGAVTNNLPTDVIHGNDLGRVIACDIGVDDSLHTRIEEYHLPSAWKTLLQSLYGLRPGLLSVLVRTGMLNAEVANAHRRKQADIVFTPPVEHVGLLEWKAFRKTVDTGYEYACRYLEENPHLIP